MARRLRLDIAELAEDTDGIILMDKDNTNLFNHKVRVTGPEDSVYSTGLFEISLSVPIGYPMKAPKCHFITEIFHPNISRLDGEVCVDVLKEKCTAPSITLKAICMAIQALLREPYEGSPLNIDAAKFIRKDLEMFTNTCHVWTKVFAKGTLGHTPYEEEIDLVVAAAEGIDKKEALRILTEAKWDTKAACNRLGIY